MYEEISVQLIYDKLNPDFYKVLEEIHGDHTKDKIRGYRLLQLFPILRIDPPLDFVSRCIDHFVHILMVETMADEIDKAMSAVDENSSEWVKESEALMQLIRDYHFQRELMNNTDMTLAEEAKEIRRVALGPAVYTRAAA
jgi:DNA primase